MSFTYDCGGLLSSFDQCGRDRDLVVAGGQVVMCIVRFDDGVITSKHHLRLTKKLDHSVAQLSWNHCLHDDVIGMASPSGKLFELKVAPDGQVTRRPFVDPEHLQGPASGLNKRQISRVRFHPTDQLIFSSSHDGQVRGFDLRAESILVTRLPFHKPADNTALPKCYDFQFERVSGNYVYAIYDNGSVVVWDWRHYQTPVDTCHLAPGQPLFSIDLHPVRKRFAAVSSRDQSIHLYSFENRETSLSMRVPNVTGRLEWRPNRPDQFATCSVTPDQLIYIWDSRRPYVPFATFDGHHKLVDVQWRRGDEHTLIAADNYEPTTDEKHGYLIWHQFQSADPMQVSSNSSAYSACITRPSETFRSAVVALSNRGDIISVQSNNRDHLKPHFPNSAPLQVQQAPMIPTTTNQLTKASSRFTMSKPLLHVPSSMDITSITNGVLVRPIDIFLNPNSSIHSFPCLEVAANINAVKIMAREYRLTGATVTQLCAHNAAVALRCKRQDVARAWELIGATMDSTCPAQISVLPGGNRTLSEKSESPDIQAMVNGSNAKSTFSVKVDQQINAVPPTSNHQINSSKGMGRSASQTTGDQETGHGGGFAGGTTTDSDVDGVVSFDFDTLVNGAVVSDGANIDQGMQDDDPNMIIPAELGPSQRRFIKVSSGEFQVGSSSTNEERRRSFESKVSTKAPTNQSTVAQSATESPSVAVKSGKSAVRLEDYFLSLAPDSEMGIFAIKSFEWSPVIIDLIESFANANDAQNAVAMLVVASPLLTSGGSQQLPIPVETQRYWFHEYVSLLSRLQLACPLAKLLNSAGNSTCPALQTLASVAQELGFLETTYTPLCHGCGDRALTITSGNNTGPVCKRCKRLPAICTVCSRPVRGLYAWCRVCLHGGHLVHFRDWFKKNDGNAINGFKAKCPAGGCEHICDIVLPS